MKQHITAPRSELHDTLLPVSGYAQISHSLTTAQNRENEKVKATPRQNRILKGKAKRPILWSGLFYSEVNDGKVYAFTSTRGPGFDFWTVWSHSSQRIMFIAFA